MLSSLVCVLVTEIWYFCCPAALIATSGQAVPVTHEELQPRSVHLSQSKDIEWEGGGVGFVPTTHGVCPVAKVCWHVQDPDAVHETYKKGQHLKGVDAANAERVRAEMVSMLTSAIPCYALNLPLTCFAQLSLSCSAIWTVLRENCRFTPAHLG